MKKRAVMLGLAAAVILLAAAGRQAKGPDGASLDAAERRENVSAACQITQTMGFSRCGHSVTRRLAAPESLRGADFEGVKSYYGLWQIESFSAERIEMTRELPLFCPMHQVLTVNEAGEIVLTRNVYGDGMAVTAAYERSAGDFPPEEREKLTRGIGFDSREEAEAWLLSH